MKELLSEIELFIFFYLTLKTNNMFSDSNTYISEN